MHQNAGRLRMRRFLADNRADKHGTHKYAPAVFGLDAADLERRYAFYTARHDVHGAHSRDASERSTAR